MGYCDFFFGSHSCDKQKGHVEAGDKIHQCGGFDETAKMFDDEGPCAQYNEETHEKRSFLWDGDTEEPIGWNTEWSDWSNAKGWYMDKEVTGESQNAT